MKKEALLLLGEEKIRINTEINLLKEELSAIDIVLSRNINSINIHTPIVNHKIKLDSVILDTLTNSEKRVYEALIVIGGDGTAREIHKQMSLKYPNEDQDKLYSSARQYSSILGNKGILDTEPQGGNKPNIYRIKEKEIESSDK